jgi:hypothetical protein
VALAMAGAELAVGVVGAGVAVQRTGSGATDATAVTGAVGCRGGAAAVGEISVTEREARPLGRLEAAQDGTVLRVSGRCRRS